MSYTPDTVGEAYCDRLCKNTINRTMSRSTFTQWKRQVYLEYDSYPMLYFQQELKFGHQLHLSGSFYAQPDCATKKQPHQVTPQADSKYTVEDMNSNLPLLAQGLELAMANDFIDLDLPVYKHEDTIDLAGEAMVFEKASQIALQLAAQIHWSNYHTWKYFRNVPEAKALQHVSRLWDAVYPFATCLGMASQVTTTLRLALLHDKNLSKFAGKVQLVSDTPAACNKGPGRVRYHCITIIQLSDHVIVIDLVAQPTAFKVSLSSAYKCRENLVPFAMNTGRWCYAYLSGPDHRRALVDCASPPVDTEEDMSESRGFPFLDIEGGMLKGVIDYAWPAANPTMKTPLGRMPWRRTINARGTWNYRPTNLFTAYTTLNDGKYLVDTVSVIIDIVGQELHFQLPYADWLVWPEHKVVHDRLTMELTSFQRSRNDTLQDAVVTCSLQLGSSSNVLELPVHGLRDPVIKSLRLLDETCAALGLPEGEIMKIGLEVAKFWKETLDNFNGTPIPMDLTQWLSSVQDLRRPAAREDLDSLRSDHSDVYTDKDFDSNYPSRQNEEVVFDEDAYAARFEGLGLDLDRCRFDLDYQDSESYFLRPKIM